MAVFLVFAPCSLVKSTDVSEDDDGGNKHL
jgi:hypothetical protein